MRTLLAAIDAGAAARPVLEAAVAVGELTGARVEAVHVLEDSELIDAVPVPAEIPLRLVTGPVEAGLLHALAAPEVIAAVFGARGTPGGRRPVGRTALRILERTSKPVVVVPPETAGRSRRPMRRIIVPLEGNERSARPVGETLCPLILGEVELVVLHVFTDVTVPRFLDHPEWDLPLWAGEFLARYCPNTSSIELRGGSVSGRVAEVCREQDADLIVLSWSQDSSAGRAAVVREVLGGSAVPVVLLPVTGEPDAPGDPETRGSTRRSPYAGITRVR